MHVSTTRIAAFPSACWCDRCAACWKARRGDLRAIRSDGQPGLKEGDDPSQWKDYLAAKDLVARATTLERHNRLFAQAIDNRRTPLDDLLQLSNDALGSSYNAGSLARLAYYNRTLFAERPADLAALDLGRVAATAADNFHDLMARWLNAYFLTDSLERTGNALTQELAQLGQERDATAAQLLGIGELINHLQQQVNRINLIWGNGVGQDLVLATRTCSRAPSKAACWETAWRNCRTSPCSCSSSFAANGSRLRRLPVTACW